MDRDNRSVPPASSTLTRRTALAGAGAAGLLGLLAGGLGRFAAAQDPTPAGMAMPMNPDDLPPGAVGVTI